VLSLGDSVLLPSDGRRLLVSRLIGEGSQGSVYEAVDPTFGSVALKWYFAHTATTRQRDAIADLVERGAPSERFLWPEAMAVVPGDRSFGYVMPLRPERFASLVELLAGKIDVPFSTVLRLCIELADSFLMLHSQGLCYRDISFSNVFFDPDDGVPLICDNDNVGVDKRAPSSVLGTRRFMAPEIVRGDAPPSTETDLYSLAVLLFYILMCGHPLVGRRELDFGCWDDRAESELFGNDPLFVFDPEDRRNEPVPDLHGAMLQYWELYPDFVRDLFVKAFTDGLRDPRNGRVRESVWRASLSRLRDRIARCTGCDRERFLALDGQSEPCWSCGDVPRETTWLRVQGRSLALAPRSTVHGHHLRHDYDFAEIVAEVVRHPNRPELVGLQNRTQVTWTAVLEDGEEREVEPGRSIRLAPETKIDFGRGIRGEVVRVTPD